MSIEQTLSAFAIVLSIGCSSGASVRPGAEVAERDSAGIHIVENSGTYGVWAPWVVRDEPERVVGWGGDVLFDAIAAGVILPDGRVVVGDAGSGLLHVLARDGRVLGVMGGQGEGPGELRNIAGIVHLGGDTILVHDDRNHRVTVWVGDEYAYDIRFESFFSEAVYSVAGRWPDGRFQYLPSSFVVRRVLESYGWLEYPILAVSGDFVDVDSIARLPIWHRRPPDDRNPIRHWGFPAFVGDHVAYGASDAPEVRWIDGAGDVVQIVRWDAASPEATDSAWADYESGYRERQVADDPAELERRIADARRDFEGPLPYFYSAHGDRAGNVWLGRYRIANGGRMTDAFFVITEEGEWLGEVELPRMVRVLDITDDRLLVVAQDELDVQAAVVYELHKGGTE